MDETKIDVAQYINISAHDLDRLLQFIKDDNNKILPHDEHKEIQEISQRLKEILIEIVSDPTDPIASKFFMVILPRLIRARRTLESSSSK